MSAVDILSRVMQPAPTPTERPRFVGVYLLLKGEEIVYVGQSTDVEMRLLAHRSSRVRSADRRRWIRLSFDRAIWLPLSAEDLSAYEGALIRALTPKYNRTAPVHRGRDNEILSILGLAQHVDEAANAERFSRTSDQRSRPWSKRTKEFNKRVRQRRELETQVLRSRRLWSAVAALFAAHESNLSVSPIDVTTATADVTLAHAVLEAQ